MTRLLAALTLLALSACEMVVGPDADASTQEGIGLTLSAAPARIAPGDTVRLVARVTNHNAHPVRLTFGGCQVLPYVENSAGKVVYPGGGGWMCAGVMSHVDLQAGEVKEEVYTWTGQQTGHDPKTLQPVHAPLPAGTYRAYATMHATLGETRVALRSSTQMIELR